MRPAAEAFGLGLLHGPAELLPVSSSAHLALIGRAAHDESAVAMHAGTAVALVVALRGEASAALRRFDVGFHLVAGAIPSLCGVVLGARAAALREPDGGSPLGPAAAGAPGEPRSAGTGWTEPRRLGSGFRNRRNAVGFDRNRGDAVSDPSRRRLAAGMLTGAAALAWADRAPQVRSRGDATLVDAAALGLAQAAALWPGVSRSGATLAAARARRFTRAAAAELSRETAVPLLLGAAAYSTARAEWAGSLGPGTRRIAPSLAGAAGGFVGTLASLPLLRLLDRPLWPWSAYRAGIALALVGRSHRATRRVPPH